MFVMDKISIDNNKGLTLSSPKLVAVLALSFMVSAASAATPATAPAKAPVAVTKTGGAIKPASKPAMAPMATSSASATSATSAPAALPVVRVLIKAAREARIASQISGRITALPVKMGQAFRRGELLVGFDCTHQAAEQAAANAMLTKANTVVVSKKSLAAMKAVSEIEVQLAEADLAQARAQLSRAVASVADCRIVAPYDGSVVNVVANHAEFVGPGSPLIEIVERGNLHVEALIRSTWLTWLRPGQRFTITVDELGRDVVAVVASIGARVDPVSQTIPVMGKIVQEVPGLRAGMSGNARFVRTP